MRVLAAGTAVALVVMTAAVLCLGPLGHARAAVPNRLRVVAAENFYGDVAGQIAGDHARVVSILSDPNVDPHEYETNAADAAAVANARLIIQNGIGYDDFIDHLTQASPNAGRILLVAAALTGHTRGDNVHLWYQPSTMPKVARAVTDDLARIDPAHAGLYRDRLGLFLRSLRPLDRKIAALRGRYKGTPVAYTEPVFGYMGEALGLDVLTPGEFQKAIEEGEDPPARAIATMEDQLRTREAKLLIYNLQTVTPITTRVRQLAKQAGVPVIGVSETEPAGQSYQQWMIGQLDALDRALSTGK